MGRNRFISVIIMKGVRIFQREKKNKTFTFFLRLISVKRRKLEKKLSFDNIIERSCHIEDN
jgi:hypothetical protein